MTKRWAAVVLFWVAACGAPEPAVEEQPPGTATCVDDTAFWSTSVLPLLQAECQGCHSPQGPAKATRYVLDGSDDREAIEALILAEPELFLDKPTARVKHGGSQRFDPYDPRYATLHEFVARTLKPGGCSHPGEAPLTCTIDTVEPGTTAFQRLTSDQIRNTVDSLLGIGLADGAVPVTKTGGGFRTWPANNTVSGAGVESFMLVAEQIAGLVSLEDVGCLDDDAACARQALVQLASQAWRRSPSEEEEKTLTRFLDAGVLPTQAYRMGLEMLLQAPQFLYMPMRASDILLGRSQDGSNVHWLQGASLATRLSYFLTNAPPDQALRDAAEAGKLNTREGVAEQARRLVQSPNVARAIRAFHRDWLDMQRFDGAQRDPAKYPNFSEATRAAIYKELDLFTTEVVWSGEATLDALLSSRVTWVNSELAALYGLADPGPGWHRVTLDEKRPGLLTRLAFLSSHGNPAGSSPVRRGAFVLQEMLCEHLEPPQDVNMDLPEPMGEATTIRERLELHWTDPGCATCHLRIDPLGFAFENFGALGEWRDNWDGGIAIDATGEFDGDKFDGAAEAIEVLKKKKRVRACYATRWFEYAVGRAAEEADACSLRQLHERFAKGEGDLRALLVDVTMTDAFLMRKGGQP